MKEQKGITLIALIITIIVMLILAGVSISLTIGENGVINQAEQANEKMTMAQIKDRAELVKASLALDIATGEAENIVYAQEFLARAAEELEGRIEGSRVITKDEKYAVSLRGLNSEIVVSKYSTDFFDITQLIEQEIEVTSDSLKIKIKPTEDDIDLTEYTKKVLENVTESEKERGALEYLSTTNTFKGIEANSLEEIVVFTLKTNFSESGINYNTLREWRNDPNVKAFAVGEKIISSVEEELTEDHIYSYLFGSTKAEFIDGAYRYGYLLFIVGQGISLAEKGENLKIAIVKDNEIIDDADFDAINGYTISNPENGTYEYTISVLVENELENPYYLELVTDRIVVNN